ncbi:unnamed protein product, partial [Effrenium voratum]
VWEALPEARERRGFVPKEGTRQAEVYRQLKRSEAEMRAELRLLEDRLVLRCLHCGFVGTPPGPANGLCPACGHFIEVLRVAPQIAQGPVLREPMKQTPNLSVPPKVFHLKPAAPAFAVRSGGTSHVTQPARDSLGGRSETLAAQMAQFANSALERLDHLSRGPRSVPGLHVLVRLHPKRRRHLHWPTLCGSRRFRRSRRRLRKRSGRRSSVPGLPHRMRGWRRLSPQMRSRRPTFLARRARATSWGT